VRALAISGLRAKTSSAGATRLGTAVALDAPRFQAHDRQKAVERLAYGGEFAKLLGGRFKRI